jgi:transcriptional regulator of acetoin/glycerol metabolism
MERYSIDPAEKHRVLQIERNHLIEHQERLENIVQIAQLEMKNLFQQISGSGFAILLSDTEGVILNSISDPSLVQDFSCAGLWMGGIWSEDQEGTNAIGTCLIERRPIIVHLNEHYRCANVNLTCSASPIFDPDGNLLAVLDVSSMKCQDSKQSQRHTLALVMLYATLIENCNFIQQFRNAWVLRFHSQPEFVGSLSEGILALSGEGRILAANRSALSQLSRDRRELLGRPISDIFDIHSNNLMGHAYYQPHVVWPIRDWRGNRFSAMLRGPDRHSFANNPTTKTLEPTETPVPMTLDTLQGGDPCMTHTVRCARRVMNKNISILLLGETGTGKEVLARAIHEASDRVQKPFVAVNCAAIPENLIESELFGYAHGAFTGARREGMRGKILQANGGTLFLDEIGDMPLHLQTRLLRVLETQEVEPLGSGAVVSVALNVICATHCNLQELVNRGAFREDLYYRLNGIVLTLPPLRERADRVLLICSTLATQAQGERVHLSAEAFAALSCYSWPGNIRQLRNVLRTALALCEDNKIRLEDLPSEIPQFPRMDLSQRNAEPNPAAQEDALGRAEREAVLHALERCHWNITRTARYLSMSRNNLYRKLKKHGIKPPSYS